MIITVCIDYLILMHFDAGCMLAENTFIFILSLKPEWREKNCANSEMIKKI